MESARLSDGSNSWKYTEKKCKIPGHDEDDGAGGVRPATGMQVRAAPRVDLLNGNRSDQTSKHALKTPKSGRGITGTSNSLLLRRRRRLKRNLSVASAAPAPTPTPTPTPVSASASTLKRRQTVQIQASDRQWIRADLHRGSVYVHDRLQPSVPPRPVLCTVESTASDVALRLNQVGAKSGSVVRVGAKLHDHDHDVDVNGNCNDGAHVTASTGSDRLRLLLLDSDRHDFEILDDHLSDLNANETRGSDVESGGAFDDLSSKLGDHRDSLSDDMILGTDASALSPAFDCATEGLDTYGSSSDELELEGPPGNPVDLDLTHHVTGDSIRTDDPSGPDYSPESGRDPDHHPASPVRGSPTSKSGSEGHTLYVQLHGEAARRLAPDERPLQIQNDFLCKLGFKDPWRVQEEGMNTELGSLIRFYAGKTAGWQN